MKYKIVGVLDILFSGLFLVTQLSMLFFVYPKMFQMYNELDVQLPFVTRYAYVFSIIFVVLYSLFFVVGIKLLKSQSKMLFVIGVVAFVIMFLLSGYFMATSVLSAVNPLYNLTNSINVP